MSVPLYEGNTPGVKHSAARGSVQEAFARVAAESPEAVAVVEGRASLTYRMLDERANQLAHRLVGLGVAPEEPVVVLMERSADVVVALLAVLKAGGTYVPLHSGFPVERMEGIIGRVRARVLLGDTAWHERGLPQSCSRVVLVDQDAVTASLPVTDPHVHVSPGGLAYVMYTSGSTGEPKGVAVTHRDVLALVADSLWDGEVHRRVLMVAPYAFDVSTYELWVPLLRGGTTVVAPTGDLRVQTLRRLLTDEGITAVHLTAGLFRVVAEEDPGCFSGVREVMTGGDVVSAAAVHRVVEHCPDTTVRALYGPTETTLFATSHRMTSVDDIEGSVPIGRPLDGMRAYVLGEALEPVAHGVVGELHLAGAGVARGYYGRPDLTSEWFVADPFGPVGERMYRTGDLVRQDESGALIFVGRTDDQVKIRGFRVEPSEVESALARFPGLLHVAVVAQEMGSDGKRLVAYVVAQETLDASRLRRYARSVLPDYMVPSHVVELPELPLTVNGKVHYRALPTVASRQPSQKHGPRSPREEVLCGLFAEILDVPAVGIDDNFFEMGGHSLLATRLVSRVRSDLGLTLPLRRLLEGPTVAQLSTFFDGELGHGDALGPLLSLRPRGIRRPVILIHPGGGLGWCYTGLLRHLPKGHPVHVLQSAGLDGTSERPRSMEAMLKGYLAAIRGVQATGPYILAGWSFGGKVAQFLATRLQQWGEQVALLAVLDAGFHRSGDRRVPDQRGLLELAFDGIDDFRAEPGDGPVAPHRVREILRARGSALAALDERTIERLVDVTRNNIFVGGEPQIEPFRGDMLFFEAVDAEGRPTGLTDLWRPYVTGRIERHVVKHPHMRLMSPEALADIGAVLAGAIERTC